MERSGKGRAWGIVFVLASGQGVGADAEEAISDNSFFIEEAYNQEPGVVQHIVNVLNYWSPQQDTVLGFTQEWPFMGRRHQLSATVPFNWLNAGSTAGFGDVMVHYRFQLGAEEGVHWAAAPRCSVLLPTGDAPRGLGWNSLGLQVNFPLSVGLSSHWMSHWNVGATWVPQARGTDAWGNEVRRGLTMVNAGASVIWLLQPTLNLMLEYVLNGSSQIDASGAVVRSTEHVLSPGVRWAMDVGTTQIVPGLAVPFSVNGTTFRTGLLMYLSVEHPF